MYCMPMLIINMGGEMVYILAQRLQAQNVPIDKSKRGKPHEAQLLACTRKPHAPSPLVFAQSSRT